MQPELHHDFDMVDQAFKRQWDGPIQDVFDNPIISPMVSQVAQFLIYNMPISPPLSNPPVAYRQQSISQPHDPDPIVAARDDCMAHIAQAQLAEVPHKHQSSIEAAELVAAVQFVSNHVQQPSILVQRRKRLIALLSGFIPQLKHLNRQLEALMPQTVRDLRKAVKINICLMYILNKAVLSPDFYLPHCFVTGFPMEGYLHRTGWYRPGHYARSNFDEDFHEWNTHLIRSIRKRAMQYPADGTRECYDATIKEVDLGFMQGPFTYDEVRSKLRGHAINAIRRFPQYRYPGAPVRPCDNGSENEENDRFESFDKLVTENADYPLRVRMLYQEALGYVPKFRLSLNDLKKAYRQMPSGHPGATVVAIWNPTAKRVEFFIVLGMPFGLASSVLQFNRPMELLQAVFRRLFAVPCAHYYDDWVAPSPAFAAKSDDSTIRALHAITGIMLDDGKHCPPNAVNAFTGVEYDFSESHNALVIIRIKPDRRTKMLELISEILETQSCTAGTASTLRGKLFFTCTQAFGRVGRAPLQALVNRQYSTDTYIDGPIADCLTFATFFLENADAFPRVFKLIADPRPHLIIWTDASWENGGGMLGAVVYDPISQSFMYSSATIPQWMIDRWNNLLPDRTQRIFQAEILAAILPYFSLPNSLTRDRRVLHFVDNTSALYALFNGYSRMPDSSWMVNMFHCLNATLRADIWWEYVASKANIADLPSRNEFDILINDLDAIFFPFLLDEGFWAIPPQALLPTAHD